MSIPEFLRVSWRWQYICHQADFRLSLRRHDDWLLFARLIIIIKNNDYWPSIQWCT